jgi:hypothetical protein
VLDHVQGNESFLGIHAPDLSASDQSVKGWFGSYRKTCRSNDATIHWVRRRGEFH